MAPKKAAAKKVAATPKKGASTPKKAASKVATRPKAQAQSVASDDWRLQQSKFLTYLNNGIKGKDESQKEKCVQAKAWYSDLEGQAKRDAIKAFFASGGKKGGLEKTMSSVYESKVESDSRVKKKWLTARSILKLWDAQETDFKTESDLKAWVEEKVADADATYPHDKTHRIKKPYILSEFFYCYWEGELEAKKESNTEFLQKNQKNLGQLLDDGAGIRITNKSLANFKKQQKVCQRQITSVNRTLGVADLCAIWLKNECVEADVQDTFRKGVETCRAEYTDVLSSVASVGDSNASAPTEELEVKSTELMALITRLEVVEATLVKAMQSHDYPGIHAVKESQVVIFICRGPCDQG